MIKGGSKGILLLTAVWILFVFGCSERLKHNAAEYSDSLIVHPRANNVKFFKHKGTDQLTYQVNEKFPASGVIGAISKKLEENGWEPLTEDFLNPGIPSSHIRGWRKFTDATKPTEQIVHSWMADWKDRSENIVTYGFRYTYPKDGKPNLEELEVIAIYMPAALAKQGREVGRKLQEELEKAQKAK